MTDTEYTFTIDVFTPNTIPMKRLAEYMLELASLYGSQERVHFVRLRGGSTKLVNKVEFEHAPKVKERLDGIKHRDAPQEAIESYSHLDDMLAEDNAIGKIEVQQPQRKSAKILEFPGRNRESAETFGPVTQTGTIDGQLIRIGGTDESVPVLLLEEESIKRYCTCNREVARRLALHLFSGVLRVYGTGKWKRDDFGNWALEKFAINDFKPLDEISLLDITAELRSVPTGLELVHDPLKELRRLRHGEE